MRVQSSKLVISGAKRWSAVRFFLIAALLTAYCLPFAVRAHEGEDHSADKKTAPTAAAGAKITSVTAERNVQTDAGQFNVQLTRTPSDPRTGETAQFVLHLGEKVEGGFGGGEPAPLENAIVAANITTASGASVAENVAAKHEGGNAYRLAFAFADAGDYKVLFNVNTGDGRSFSTDFPISVGNAPMNWTFWLGLAVLSLLTLGALGFFRQVEGRG